ncbi:hypothetical protein HNQ36_005282 [Afipia massiliensis]|uniref:Uncharacterized protein n=1 Tax=Afipia massiliensis TaxID=211460 RepID=A0A840NC88_9BRAD|nr:hypothetical protein [Afipia massiliensis]MBB5055271.1 hypothetical protein [Afipia massiliensis]
MPNIDSQVNANTAQQQNDVSSQLTEIAGRGTRFSLGAQRLALYEILRVSQDALDYARSGVNITQDCISRIAGAHSVKDIATAVRDCGHRQLDQLQEDYEHLIAHGHEVFDVSSGLVLAAFHGEHPQE